MGLTCHAAQFCEAGAFQHPPDPVQEQRGQQGHGNAAEPIDRAKTVNGRGHHQDTAGDCEDRMRHEHAERIVHRLGKRMAEQCGGHAEPAEKRRGEYQVDQTRSGPAKAVQDDVVGRKPGVGAHAHGEITDAGCQESAEDDGQGALDQPEGCHQFGAHEKRRQGDADADDDDGDGGAADRFRGRHRATGVIVCQPSGRHILGRLQG